MVSNSVWVLSCTEGQTSSRIQICDQYGHKWYNLDKWGNCKSKQYIFNCSSCSLHIEGGASFSGTLLALPSFSSWRSTTLWVANTFIFLCDLMQSLQINSIHWRQNTSAFVPEHILQVAYTFPCTFSIFTWRSFIRLTKNAVGSWSGSFCDKAVPHQHLGCAKGQLGPARLQYRSAFQSFNLIGWVRVY